MTNNDGAVCIAWSSSHPPSLTCRFSLA